MHLTIFCKHQNDACQTARNEDSVHVTCPINHLFYLNEENPAH